MIYGHFKKNMWICESRWMLHVIRITQQQQWDFMGTMGPVEHFGLKVPWLAIAAIDFGPGMGQQGKL